MKEIIEFNYNIIIDELFEAENLYYFYYQNDIYIFINYNRNIEELNDITKCLDELKQRNIPIMPIMLNKNNQLITKDKEYNYVLLKCLKNYYQNVDFMEIIENNKKLKLNDTSSNLYRNNWSKLWQDKIDYLEYQISELGHDKEIIINSFSYYIGLAENAIELVNHTQKNVKSSSLDYISLSHRRIFYPNYKLNYYNPLSFIFDLEVRDIAEYLKAYFFSNQDAFLELTTYLKTVKLGLYSYQMLYARLLYPSYYFDLYTEIMEKNKNQDALLNIITKVDDYETFLKKAYLEISKYAPIEKIEWLNS
jgi:spore coat protein YutH